MKIRCDFVTNSSSTAFVLIRKSELTRDGIAKLLGIADGSPLSPVADALYSCLDNNRRSVKSYKPAEELEVLRKDFASEVVERVRAAQAAGMSVEVGSFRSDGEGMEALFCTDSFEVENDEYYVNALRSYW